MSNLAKSTAKGTKTLRKSTESDTDTDEELQTELEKAVRQYKQNYNQKKIAPLLQSSGEKLKCRTDEIDENQQKDFLNKNNEYCEKKPLGENLSANTDLQKLIKYFMLPKKDQKKALEKKTYDDYVRQGAIPKGKVRDDSSRIQPGVSNKKNLIHNSKANDKSLSQILYDNPIKSKSKKTRGAKVEKTDFNLYLNDNCEIKKSPTEKLCAIPFFYIVPENPSSTFFLPCGSYYVVPKIPDSFSQETVIRHPESSDSIKHLSGTELSSKIPNPEKALDTDINLTQSLSRNLNNLSKEAPLHIDSHLNIGPTQVRENYSFENLECNSNFSKMYDKAVIVPEELSKTISTPHETNGNLKQLKQSIQRKEVVNNNTENFPIATEEFDDESYVRDEVLEKIYNAQQRLMFEFPEMDLAAVEEFAACYYMDEQNLEGFIASRHLSEKIERQYSRLLQALPESCITDLRAKSEEFEGDEVKELAYIEEVKHRNKSQQLLTDMQCIFPDADTNFLSRKIEEVIDDPNAVDILTIQLLENHDYPKICGNDCERRKSLWLFYVRNFEVKKYLLKVPNPEDFEGPAGDNNKADENLIIKFLKARYPDASEFYLTDKFISHQRNITRTCFNISQFEIVRLSESNFEHENFDEDLLKEVCYIDHKAEITNHLKTVKEMKEIEMITARLDEAFLYCPLCSDEELIPSEVVTCPEGHVFCKTCIKRYFEVKISDAIYKFACPSEDCDTFFTIPIVEELMPDIISSVIIKKLQAEEVSTAEVDGLESCPQCDFAYIPNPEDKIFKCLNPLCLTEICRKCHEKNHIPLRCEEIERPADLEARKKIEETMTEKLIRRCPKCSKSFLKIDGCNKIRCTCGVLICYICRNVVNGYDHFSQLPSLNRCPLYSTNEDLHVQQVIQAGVELRDKILNENPTLRIFYDPTK